MAEEAAHGRRDVRVTLYGQEKDNATAGLARMNMILHDYATAEIRQGNTLVSPLFLKADALDTFDYVVANPPFSDKRWSTGLDPEHDPYDRFIPYGVPPPKQGDYAYLLHILRSLRPTGKGACILPHGVLFRGGAEGAIRRNLVQRGYVKGIIGLPPNLFFGTGIPACIVVLDKEGAAARKGIFLIDASKGFRKEGPKNRLRAQDIHKIVDTFTRQSGMPRYARMVPVAEISDPKNDYNLNLPRYIDGTEPEDLQDINGHLRGGIPERDIDALDRYWKVMPTLRGVRLFFVEEFLPYSWAFLPADASLQCSVRGDSNQASAYPRLSGGQPSLETAPNTVGLSPSGALPSGHSRGVLVRFHGQGDRPVMAVTTGFQGRRFDAPEARTGVPRIDLPSPAPCAAADAVFADAKAFLSSNEARQMSESELERELHRRGQKLVRKLLQGHHDQRSPGQAAGPAEDASGVECSARREQDSHAETTSGTMQVVGLGCARRGHDGLHPLDAALNLLPERSLVDMRRRVTIATASRAPPRTPWKPQWYSTLSTWQRRCGVRCSSPAH